MTTPTEPASTTPPAEPTTTPPQPPATGEDETAAKLKKLRGDLDRERSERHSLQEQLKALQERDPVKAIAEALGVKPTEAKGDDLAATVKQMQQQMRDAELKAARLEVAAEKGLTPQQAARLQGATREELAADADSLKALFPTPAAGTPAPDPSQGARGGASDLEARLKAAQEKGDTREAIRLKTALAEQKRN